MKLSWRAPILIAIGVVLGVLSLTGTFTTSGGYTLTAEFADASGLRPNYFVKIDGVTVGRVASVTVSRRDTAIVTMQLDQAALPIGRNVTATIRPNSFFGEHYVDLNPGDIRDTAPSGTTIPVSRTGEATELDQLLDTLDPKTRVALAELLNEGGIALAGRGQDLATTLSRLPPTLQDAQELIANLAIDNTSLGQLVDRSSQIVAAIAHHRGALGRLVANAEGTLVTVASRNQALGKTLQSAPGAVARLYTMLGYLRTSSEQLIPAAHGLKAAAAPLTGLLQALPAFSRAARPALNEAQAAAPLLNALGSQATPVVTGLDAPTSRLVDFTRALSPVASGLNTSIDDLLGYWEGYARALEDKDAAGHIYRPAQTYASLKQIVALFDELTGTHHESASGRAVTPSPAPAVGKPIKQSRPGRAATPVRAVPLRTTLTPSPSPTQAVPSTVGHLLRYLLGP